MATNEADVEVKVDQHSMLRSESVHQEKIDKRLSRSVAESKYYEQVCYGVDKRLSDGAMRVFGISGPSWGKIILAMLGVYSGMIVLFIINYYAGIAVRGSDWAIQTCDFHGTVVNELDLYGSKDMAEGEKCCFREMLTRSDSPYVGNVLDSSHLYPTKCKGMTGEDLTLQSGATCGSFKGSDGVQYADCKAAMTAGKMFMYDPTMAQPSV